MLGCLHCRCSRCFPLRQSSAHSCGSLVHLLGFLFVVTLTGFLLTSSLVISAQLNYRFTQASSQHRHKYILYKTDTFGLVHLGLLMCFWYVPQWLLPASIPNLKSLESQLTHFLSLVRIYVCPRRCPPVMQNTCGLLLLTHKLLTPLPLELSFQVRWLSGQLVTQPHSFPVLF